MRRRLHLRELRSWKRLPRRLKVSWPELKISKRFQFGGKPRGISTTVGSEEAAKLATRESENATCRQSASCEVEGAISLACPYKAMQPKVDLDFSCSVRVIVVMGTRVAVVMGTTTVDTRAALEAVAQHRPNAVVADKMPTNTRQAD